MKRISSRTVEEVNSKVDMVEIVGEYTRLEKRGGNWWGCCPFHNEKTPSFNIMPEKNLYHCFGCGVSGTVISFVMEMEKLSFTEAVESLARKNGIEVIYEGSGEIRKDEKKDNIRELLMDLYDRTAGMFHFFLTESKNGKEALDYIKGRSVDEETIKKFKLGFAPKNRNWLYGFLTSKGYSSEFLASSGLFSRKYPTLCVFAGRIIFPIADRKGRIVAFGGRILSGEGPKYINSGDLPQYKKGETLFGFNLALPEIRATKSVILCEGYMDVLAWHQAGICNAVAPLGTAFTPEQAKLAHSFAETAFLCFDTDTAGQKASYAAILLCRKTGMETRIVDIKGSGFADCKDPADILKNHGAEALKKVLEMSILDVDYLILNAGSSFDLGTPGGKAQACGYVFPYLEVIDSDVLMESVVSRISSAFGISGRALLSDFQKRNQPSNRREMTETNPPAGKRKIKPGAELRAMLAAASNMQFFPQVRNEISADDLEDPAAKDIFIILEECFRNDTVGFDAVLERCREDNLRSIIMQAYASGEFSENADKVITDSIKLIKKNVLEKKKAGLIARIRLAPVSDGSYGGHDVPDMMSQIREIDEKLKDLKDA